jgi:hypothetical protein
MKPEMHYTKQELEHEEPNHSLNCLIVNGDLHSSEILHSVEWQFLVDVSGQPIVPIFKGQEIQKNRARLKLIFGTSSII